MSWELSAWNISLCLYTILQHHWANNLLMLYQPEETLFIFFTARIDPCQVRAIARYDIKSETPCFLLAIVSSQSEKRSWQKTQLNTDLKKKYKWDLIFSHLSPGLMKSIPNSPPTHPKPQSQEKKLCATVLAAHALTGFVSYFYLNRTLISVVN